MLSSNARACGSAFCAAVVFSAAHLSLAATMVLPSPTPTTLDTLLVAGATYQVGDKLFSDFTYHFTGTMPDASGINVLPIQDMDGNFGFRLEGDFVDLPGGSSSDSVITFNVTALDPTQLIIDAHLAADVMLSGTGGLASVTETFLPLFPTELLMVFDTPGAMMLSDSVVFDTAVRTLPVQKDILLLSTDTSGQGSARMSFVDQTFSQIPEPSTLSMVGLVGLALVLRFRRK
jgi:hypothetical protein